MEQPRCDTCPFWDKWEAQNSGYCRAMPPDPNTDEWPRTRVKDWCGSHPAMTAKFIEERYKQLFKERDEILEATT